MLVLDPDRMEGFTGFRADVTLFWIKEIEKIL